MKKTSIRELIWNLNVILHGEIARIYDTAGCLDDGPCGKQLY